MKKLSMLGFTRKLIPRLDKEINNMEKAYKLAREGGYEGRVYAPKLGAELLDPQFWQALGKSLWWDGGGEDFMRRYKGVNEELIFKWQYHWHSFIDHLAEGGNVDEFFNKLLKAKNK